MSQKKSKYSSRKKKRTQPLLPLLLALGGVLLVGAALFSLLGRKPGSDFTPQVSGAPSIKADQEKVDLGDVPLGQTVQVSFTLTNVGDETLRFQEAPYIEVREGC